MIIEKLNAIQTKLVATKDKTNDFAKFKYRSAETILENIKPLLDGCAVTLSDELVNIDGILFIKATAQLLDGNESVSATAYAQMDAHKGMSAEQATGTASSYARKYALCGLFMIDDNKDVDSMDNTEKGPVILCADCGKEITNGKRQDGSIWPAADIAAYTERKYGRALCYECGVKEGKKK